MPVSIFFCYAREDEALLNKLKSHLRPLQRQGLIDVWCDRDITAGTDWEKEISKHLNTSQIILLLISPDFMDSDYCYGVEMKRAIERHELQEACVIPVILYHLNWRVGPLRKLQALPTDGEPVISRHWYHVNEALFDIAVGIRKVVEQLTILHPADLPVVPDVTPPIELVLPPVEIGELSQIPPIQLPPPGVEHPFFTTRKQEERVSSENTVVSQLEKTSQASQSIYTPIKHSPSTSFPPEPPMSKPQGPGTTLFVYRGHSGQVNAVAWSPDGKRLASASNDWTVHVWDLSTGGNAPFTYLGHSSRVNAVAWSPNGKRLASAGNDCTVQIWDLSTGRDALLTYRGHSNSVNAVAWSPDGKWLASASNDKTVHIWDANTGRDALLTYQGHDDPVRSVVWSPDGKWLASASYDETVQVWDASTGSNLLLTYEGHSDWVVSAAWSPDGQHLASASYDETVQVWDASTGSNLLLTYEGHSAWVASVAWSPDGKWLASAGNDCRVQIWDASTGRDALLTYLGHSDLVRSVAWSPDGKWLASASYDGTVQVWEA